MTTTSLTSQLSDALQSVTTLLSSVAADDWHRPQNGKWSVAQEVEHLRSSTQGTAFLFSETGRATWRPTTQPSRSYETVAEQYQAGLAARNGIANPNLTTESQVPDLSAQAAAWNGLVPQLLNNVSSIPESDLASFTVWKHPVLGPVTGWEMLYFTIHHTRHHHRSMAKKAGF